MSTVNQVTHLDIARIRQDFPILKTTNRGKPIVYLDSAATTQKPIQVIESEVQFYANDNANIHRGIYELSERSTRLYESARVCVQGFLNASAKEEIIFLRSTTEAINLVATCFQQGQWQAGDEIILSEFEHHSNIVPWYFLKEKIGVQLKIIPIKADGSLDLSVYESLFSPRTKLVAVSHVSNVLGTIAPIKTMTEIAHAHHVPLLVDGAQAVPHLPVDVQALDCDFYTFSSHKVYGPTGIGVLYGKKALLDVMPPYEGGGSMIETVSFDKITYAKLPHKFEAGTPNFAGAIGLQAAIQYLQGIGFSEMDQHEQALLSYAERQLQEIPGLRLLGTAHPKVGVLSFVVDGMHPHDVGTILDHEGIAVRAGHHCAMPLMQRLGVPATLRASLGIYNQTQDIDALVAGLQLAKRLLCP